jgi:ribosomal-protein-alanine N-acetyltransferase
VNNLGTETIKTKRLILRKFEIADALNMFNNWSGSNSVCTYLSWEPHGDEEFTKKIIQSWINEYQQEHNYNWAIVLKETSQPIGSITVIALSQRHKSCEIGYCLSEQFWNRGIMTEAVRAIISFLFKEVGLMRIQAHYDTLNVASGKLLVKAGMSMEGTLRKRRIRRDGSVADGHIMAIIYEDWAKQIGYA